MNIHIRTVPHKSQKYDTVGDYQDIDGTTQIWISKMDDKSEFLVAIHELIEWFLTKQKGISEKNITEFDKKFEQLRTTFPELIGEQEPGDMISAPYYEQHQKATQIEKLVAEMIGVKWSEYNKIVNSL